LKVSTKHYSKFYIIKRLVIILVIKTRNIHKEKELVKIRKEISINTNKKDLLLR